MPMGSRNPQSPQRVAPDGPGWMLLSAVFALALGLIALPWIIIGVLAERILRRWLHWKVSLLLWLFLLGVCAFVLYSNYQHGLQALIFQELAAYIAAAKRYQTDLAHWPLHALWSQTLTVWLRSWQSIGIAGFCAEIFIQPRTTTTQALQQQERKRHQRMQRSQRRARRRSSQSGGVPDAIGGMMIMGIPLYDELEGEQHG